MIPVLSPSTSDKMIEEMTKVLKSGTKKCPVCKEIKDVSCYSKRSGARSHNLRGRCKLCEVKAAQKYISNNRESYLKNKAIKKKLNRDKYNFYERKRKFVLRSPTLFGTHSIEDWELLKKTYQYKCLCCEKKEPSIKLTEDHIIPISKGGSNLITNIQPLCIKCNQVKNSKTISYEDDTSFKS